MAKKTVLKRVLKYAPLKSDFMRAVSQDETIKTEVGQDMYEVPAAYIEVEAETGEVIEEKAEGIVEEKKGGSPGFEDEKNI